MVELDVSKRGLKLMEDAMNAASRKSKQSVDVSVKKAAWQVSRSMGAAVKPKSVNTKREVVKNPEYTRGRRRAKLAIKYLRQSGNPDYRPTRKGKSDPRRRIRLLGLASASFKFIGRKFGKKISGIKVPTMSKHGYGVYKRTRVYTRAAIVSSLTYIEKVFPGAAEQALKKGLTSFIRTFDRDWATALKDAKWA
jgi:hypothetical protein